MMILQDYLLFFLKTITILGGFVAAVVAISKCNGSDDDNSAGSIKIKDVSKEWNDIRGKIIGKKNKKPQSKLFVIHFKGDLKASQTNSLAKTISAIINSANPKKDQVLIRINSPGGSVHGYGLACAQLMRLKKANIRLTAAVDEVAASGGYLMACVADKLIAAPFAIIGSIGVILQVPNFHKLLEKNLIEFEQVTAGKNKRNLTFCGKNTPAARKKAQEQVNQTHKLFKDFVSQHRPQINIDKVSNGDYWHAMDAIEHKLVDSIQTYDEFLLEHAKKFSIYRISADKKPSFMQKLTQQVSGEIIKQVSDQFSLNKLPISDI